MRNVIFAAWALMLLTAIGMILTDAEGLKGWIIGLIILSLLMLILFVRMAVLPGRVASRGFELLLSQDFNNRLVPVGERNADRIVKLFNEMIDRLRGERLKNLEQDSFLRLLIDASPMGVLMLDFDGKISMGNPAFLRLAGLDSEKDIIGKRVEQLTSEAGRQLKDVKYQENKLIRPGDSRLFRCSHLSFVQSGFNRHFYLVENLTEEVMKAERSAYEKVIRTISHEVNNTMGGVKAVFGLMMEDEMDEDMRAVIESCDSRCEEMCGFIRAYADVVKTPLPDLLEMELEGMVENMLPFLRMIAGDGIEIRFEKSEEGMRIKGDRAQLEQVIVNIVK
ncbi:MAG: PAS domain-containing protein, partial [Muribaculaceae bacterium]|nr:PAS domain-containing protein [Muribaculaceae bacterium]